MNIPFQKAKCIDLYQLVIFLYTWSSIGADNLLCIADRSCLTRAQWLHFNMRPLLLCIHDGLTVLICIQSLYEVNIIFYNMIPKYLSKFFVKFNGLVFDAQG